MPELVPTIALGVLATGAAAHDVFRRTIPNWINLLVLIGGAVAMIIYSEASVLSHLGHFAIALLAGMILFRFGLWGGGDAKFYASVALWFPLAMGVVLAVSVALAGAVLVVICGLVGTLRRDKSWRNALPYGVAIAAGAGLAMMANAIPGLENLI